MILDFLKNGFDSLMNFNHSQGANNKAAQVVDSSTRALVDLAEKARANGQSVIIHHTQIFNYGSGTTIFNLPSSSPIGSSQNGPTASITDALLCMEDYTPVYRTMFVLCAVYGFYLFKDSLTFPENTEKKLSYEDEDILDLEISFWEKFNKKIEKKIYI